MREIRTGARCAVVFGAEDVSLPVVWTVMDRDMAARLHPLLPPCVLAAVEGVDWNHDLTPWPGKAVFRGQPDFGGGAEDFLRELTRAVIPSVEGGLSLRPSVRMIAGYSLAGLFSVYASMQSGYFDGVACVSGSLWYEGFPDWMESAPFAPRFAAMSVGEREKHSRNPAFSGIEERMRECADILRRRGVGVSETIYPGGHFDDPVGRMAQEFSRLLRALGIDEASVKHI